MNKFLEIMKEDNIQVNLSTLCIGFKLHYIAYKSFKKYELVKFLDNTNITLALEVELFESKDEYQLSKLCDLLLAQLSDEQELFETNKWLYACLKDLRNTTPEKPELLQKVSEVYADFNYPSTMQAFIYYMPPSDSYDPTQYTLEENRERLIKLLDEYLIKLHETIVPRKKTGEKYGIKG